MTVRRLAPDEVQPASFAFSKDNIAFAETVIARYPEGRQASAVIPLLWRAQEQHDYWLPKAAIETVAQMLGMPVIRVLEVATFYSMFNLAPVGTYFVQVCGTTPCRLSGAEKIIDVCKAKIGEERHVRADGKFSWLEVECLGACCNAPMVQINNDYYEDLTEENFAKLLDDITAGKKVKIGSQTGRKTSEPTGAPATLTDSGIANGAINGDWKLAFAERVKAAEVAKKAAAATAAASVKA
jgi:NADH-quinone oxidoreductase subunit E